LAAALNKPTVAIYGPTDTKLVGISGKNVEHICVQQGELEFKDDKSSEVIKTNKRFDYSSVTAQKVFSIAGTMIDKASTKNN